MSIKMKTLIYRKKRIQTCLRNGDIAANKKIFDMGRGMAIREFNDSKPECILHGPSPNTDATQGFMLRLHHDIVRQRNGDIDATDIEIRSRIK